MLSPITVLLVTNYRADKQKSMLRFSSLLLENGKEMKINYKEIYPIRKLNFKQAPQKITKWLGYADKFLLFKKKYAKAINRINKNSHRNSIIHITDHSNSLYIPTARSMPCILTCHDMIAIRSSRGEFPSIHLSKTGKTLQHLICSAIPKADYIACDSNHTESDLLEICPETQGRTKTIHLGIMNNDERPIKPTIEGIVLGNIRFILHVGNPAWYKNRKSLLEAFSILTSKESWNDLHLILVGSYPTKEEIANFTKDSLPRIMSKIHTLENLAETELNYLYKHACALIFPSLIEGFGWPPLEAQKFGCPVVASSAGSLRETLADSAININPNSPNHIAKGISRLLEDRILEREITRKGRINAARFPFKKTVQKYDQLYKEILDRP